MKKQLRTATGILAFVSLCFVLFITYSPKTEEFKNLNYSLHHIEERKALKLFDITLFESTVVDLYGSVKNFIGNIKASQ